MPIFFIMLLGTLMATAQHSEQPAKESNSDLRGEDILFSIEDVKNGKTYRLERTPDLNNYLRLMSESNDEVIRKIDSRDAKKIDQEFASRFLKTQYEIASVEGDCKVTLRLKMKSEEQELCQKDEKKTQEIKGFVQDLSKRF